MDFLELLSRINMENILIKNLEKKDNGMLIVDFNGNRKASVAKWKAQEQDYLINDIGIGGEAKVEIVQNGAYTNIESVDFSFGRKFAGNSIPVEVEKVLETIKKPSREDSIIAQCMVKAAVDLTVAKHSNTLITEDHVIIETFGNMIKEAVGGYKLALKYLE